MLSEGAEEILEALWVKIEEQGNKPIELAANRDNPAIEELIRLGLIRVDRDHIYLLEKGRSQALGCVRRHRLAERLMVDILDVKKKNINEVSCKFEHLLHKGLEDNVCTLLGHPKVCPHGKPIPRGKCCLGKKYKIPLKFVASLGELDAGDKGVIAYLQSKDKNQMQKLISIGALPGISITLLQKFPSYVFQIGQSQFAIDRELAESIYVRLIK
ncbi:MAG: metal-dependent transcriptional regulator [Candidatus Omnitrophica bacterium]|nr:metal-dependent transcriptional regulator [Candidatus Omnitrophota bacterium]